MRSDELKRTCTLFGVEIPFSEQLIFRKKRLSESDMRSFDLLLGCIAVSALLHQRSRDIAERAEKAVVIATWQDFLNVKDTFLETVPRTSQAISSDLLELFTEKLLPWWNEPANLDQDRTKKQISACLGMSLEATKRFIYQWVNADLLIADTTSARDPNDRKSYYRLAEDCRALVKEIKQDGDLKMNEVFSPAEFEQTVNRESHNAYAHENGRPGALKMAA
jgi:hypothetical protein